MMPNEQTIVDRDTEWRLQQARALSLQLKVQYCVERAEQAKRGDVRQRWLEAADSWRLAIEYRIIVPDLIADWTNLKLVAAGQPVPSPGTRRPD
jgi:hypothetical protein